VIESFNPYIRGAHHTLRPPATQNEKNNLGMIDEVRTERLPDDRLQFRRLRENLFSSRNPLVPVFSFLEYADSFFASCVPQYFKHSRESQGFGIRNNDRAARIRSKNIFRGESLNVRGGDFQFRNACEIRNRCVSGAKVGIGGELAPMIDYFLPDNRAPGSGRHQPKFLINRVGDGHGLPLYHYIGGIDAREGEAFTQNLLIEIPS
jgi:hypothetical protein